MYTACPVSSSVEDMYRKFGVPLNCQFALMLHADAPDGHAAYYFKYFNCTLYSLSKVGSNWSSCVYIRVNMMRNLKFSEVTRVKLLNMKYVACSYLSLLSCREIFCGGELASLNYVNSWPFKACKSKEPDLMRYTGLF